MDYKPKQFTKPTRLVKPIMNLIAFEFDKTEYPSKRLCIEALKD